MENTTYKLFGSASIFVILNFLTSDIAIIFYICIVTDFLTGVINALIKKEFDYHQVLMGIYNKVLEIVIITFCTIAGEYLGVELSNTVILFYIVYELLSIASNIREYVYIPDKIIAALENCKNKHEKDIKED